MDTGKEFRIIKQMNAGERAIVSTVQNERRVVLVSSAGETENGFKSLLFGSDLSMEIIPGKNTFAIIGDRSLVSVRLEAPKGVKSGV